ncbi:MAG: hypothetical protein WCI03_03000 [bacterium]|jgi:hypothetical protein
MQTEDSMKDGVDAAAVDAVAPEQLLVVFTRGRILFWAAVAVAIHVVVIGVTSVGYIRDRWIDPEGAKVRKEAAVAALAAEKAREKPQPPPAPAASNAPAVAATATNVASATTNVTPASGGGEAAQLEARRNTTVVKRITEAASSNEIPKKPELGISLEDTNLR